MKLYLPTNSLNFNDIFATESISPKDFYARRTFGTKRHFGTELSVDDYTLTWYVQKPVFELVDHKSSQYEEYPILIELNCDPSVLEFVRVNDQTYLSYKTVYFDRNNVNFFFFSKEHLNTIISKSKLVDETKLVEKYKLNMHVISENQLRKVQTPIVSNTRVIEQEKEIIHDKFYNHLKGFVYSYIAIKFDEDKQTRRLYELDLIIKQGLEKSRLIDFVNEIEIVRDVLIMAEKYMNRMTNKNSINQTKLFPIDTINGTRLKLNTQICDQSDELRAFEVTINTIIQNPKSKVGEVSKDEFISLIKKVKENIGIVFGDSSTYKTDLMKIEDRVLNRAYDININTITSDVMKNLLVFIIKNNNIEELEKYLKAKGIIKIFMAYSYLGAFYGFSGLSRRVTHEFFNSQNDVLVAEVDNKLNQLKLQINSDKLYNSNPLIRKQEDNKIKDVQEKTKGMYEKDLFEIDSDKNDIEKQIFSEIQRIRKPHFLAGYLDNPNTTTIENGSVVSFRKNELGVQILFGNKEINLAVYLVEKQKATKIDYNNFRNKLKALGLSTSVSQGKYPVFKYGKSINELSNELNLEELKQLVICLRLLI